MLPIKTDDGANVYGVILQLGAKLLLGKSDQDEIDRVTELAKKHNCLDVLRRELEACTQVLTTLNTQKGAELWK